MRSTRHSLAKPLLASLGACVLIAGGAARVADAQGDRPGAAPAQSWLRVDTIQVRPERWEEFRAIERDEVIPALRKAGVPARAAWRTAEFGSTYEVVLVRPVRDFNEYDTGDSLSRALAPGDAERLRQRLRRCVLSRESAALLQRNDLSVGETGRPFVVVTTLAVAPGRGAEYEAFLRDTLPDLRKAGVIFGVYQRIYGQPAAWLLVQNLDSLSELTRPPSVLVPEFGQDGAERVAGRLSGVLTSIERKVFRFDPELSFSFPGTADEPR